MLGIVRDFKDTFVGWGRFAVLVLIILVIISPLISIIVSGLAATGFNKNLREGNFDNETKSEKELTEIPQIGAAACILWMVPVVNLILAGLFSSKFFKSDKSKEEREQPDL